MNSIIDVRELINILIEDEPLEKVPSKKVFEIAQKNDLLFALCELIQKEDSIPGKYQEVYRQMQEFSKNTIQYVETVLNECHKKNINYITIKSFLPFSYIDSNVDIVFIDPETISLLVEILEGMGFRRKFSLADIREPLKRMYHFQGQNDNIPRLHIHRAISWNGIIYLDNNVVWKRRRPCQFEEIQVPIPSPEDELLIMAAHAVFENKYLTLGNLLHYYHLSGEDLDWDYIQRSAQKFSWYRALTIFLATVKRIAVALDLHVETFSEDHYHEKTPPPTMPHVIPINDSFRATLPKFYNDVTNFRIRLVFREFITYFIVDPFWMYRKARKKPKARLC